MTNNEKCEACDKARGGETFGWTWTWSDLAKRALCFCPSCAERLPSPSEDRRLPS